MRAVIDKFTVTNVSANNAVFSCNLVPDGGAVANSNEILEPRVIVPGQTYLCPELVGQILDPTSYISTLSDTASALVISVGGREIT